MANLQKDTDDKIADVMLTLEQSHVWLSPRDVYMMTDFLTLAQISHELESLYVAGHCVKRTDGNDSVYAKN